MGLAYSSMLLRFQAISLAVVISIRAIFKLQTLNRKTFVFVNYRAFGHSIIDSFGVYDFYRNRCFIISIGESFERNISLFWIIPSSSLMQITLPSNLRKLRSTSKISLRKYVGPRVSKYLKFAKRVGLIDHNILIEDQNSEIMLDLAPHHLKKYVGWDTIKIKEYINERISIHKLHDITLSNGVGTQIYSSIVSRLSKDQFDIPRSIDEAFLQFLTSRFRRESKDVDIYCLIISSRGKPHHGNGLDRYFSTVSKLLQSPNSVIFLLGDYGDPNELRRLTNYSRRVVTPEEFGLEPKMVQFLSIWYSKLVIGDPGGVWNIFLLLGERGIIVDQTPTGEFYNRCLHIPRIWRNDLEVRAPLKFLLKDSLFAVGSLKKENQTWRSRLHTSTELDSVLIPQIMNSPWKSSRQISNEISDTLDAHLLKKGICGIVID